MTILPLTEEIINAQKIYRHAEQSKLKSLRLSHHWTQQQLAYRTRISVALIGAYEQNKRQINNENRRILAKVLRCKMTDF